MEEALHYEALIDGTTDLVHIVNLDGGFVFVNHAWLQTLGYSEDEVSDLRLKDVIFAESLAHYQELLTVCHRGESVRDVEAVFLTKTGERVYVEGILFPYIVNGKPTATQGFYRNVTARKLTEKQFLAAKMRSELILDLLTHDLTNINQEVLSVLELILHNPDLPTQLGILVQEGLVEIERGAELISKVKKLFLLETEKPEMSRQDLSESIERAAANVRASFADKELELITNLQSGQFFVVADKYLDDVFFALLHNSMKFDKNEKVTVEIDVEAIRHTPFLKIQVTDRGSGIPDEYKEEVFAKMADRRDGVLGLGLGLTLVKTILENYGGQIRADDRVEGDSTKGASFVILLHGEYIESGSNKG